MRDPSILRILSSSSSTLVREGLNCLCFSLAETRTQGVTRQPRSARTQDPFISNIVSSSSILPFGLRLRCIRALRAGKSMQKEAQDTIIDKAAIHCPVTVAPHLKPTILDKRVPSPTAMLRSQLFRRHDLNISREKQTSWDSLECVRGLTV